MSWDFQTEPAHLGPEHGGPGYGQSAFPSEHVPARRAAAMAKYADVLARVQAGG